MSIPVLTWVAEPRGDGGEDTWLCSGTSVNYWKCELSALQTTFQRRDTIYLLTELEVGEQLDHVEHVNILL